MRFFADYKIGAGVGLLYGVIGLVFLYGLGLCQNSNGLCVIFNPLVFHENIVKLFAKSLATPVFLVILNLLIFVFEGAAIEMVVRKVK